MLSDRCEKINFVITINDTDYFFFPQFSKYKLTLAINLKFFQKKQKKKKKKKKKNKIKLKKKKGGGK